MRPWTARCVALVLFAPLAAGPARAYSEKVHQHLTAQALPGLPDASVSPATEAELSALRLAFYRAALAQPNTALRKAFLARYPSEASFDAWAFKELCALNPAVKVAGFDGGALGLGAGPLPLGLWLSRASRWPDDDGRNRDRLARGPDHQPLRGPAGELLPDDPATLDFGALQGLSSQAHAHYGLLPPPLSDDPQVLKSDPRRFAIPPTAHALGPELAQLYTDLALLAAIEHARAAGGADPSPGFASLAFAGAAFHHLEDLGNQIHTVQVGSYPIFEAAFLQSKLRDLATFGGLWGPRHSLKQIGLQLLQTHHLLAEAVFERQVLEGKVALAPHSASADSELAAPPSGDPAFAFTLAQELIEQGSREGPEVYRFIWAASAKRAHRLGDRAFDDAQDDPRDWLRHDAEGDAALAQLRGVQQRGFQRAARAVALWWQLAEARRIAALRSAQTMQAAEEDAVARVLAFALPYAEAAEARRAAYRPAHEPDRLPVAWGFALGELALLAAVCGLGAWLLRRRAVGRARRSSVQGG